MARARTASGPSGLHKLPLFLLLWGIAALSMMLPAIVAMADGNENDARSFAFSCVLGVIIVSLVSLAIFDRVRPHGTAGQLMSLFMTFVFLPVFLALPVWDALGNTRYLNAYFDMVSALTTTGAPIFPDPQRLSEPLHLWRAQVGWMGGLLMWVAASAILAPMSLGGFEVTARGALGRDVEAGPDGQGADRVARFASVALSLGSVYAGLTGALWIMLMMAGDTSLVALCHAMSVMATSGISPIGGLDGATSGLVGEVLLFLFMLFALSRLTFSSDTVTNGHGELNKDPEFRIGVLIVVSAATFLFLRHWISIYDLDSASNPIVALRAFWGSLFTVMSYLSTTGFVSSEWDMAQAWSGLGTTGLILMGLALVGGGVATTAGGVKLLRVFALYLNGLREMERLVHPSSVSGAGGANRRIQRDGAYIAWIFFMLFALSLAAVTILLTAFGVGFEDALVVAVATLSTTGPVIEFAGDAPVRLTEFSAAAKFIACLAMVLGRLETLAIIALLTPNLWRI